MDDIKTLLEINWGYVFVALCSALLGFKLIYTAAHWLLFDVIGIETKKMKQRREDHELLIKTSQNLIALQEKHNEDAEISDKHDSELDEKLTTFMTEVRYEIKNLINDRLYDRKCSREYRAECSRERSRPHAWDRATSAKSGRKASPYSSTSRQHHSQ